MTSTGPVPLTTALGPLVIRARLSTHDDTDSDISPVYSDISGDSYESASDPGEGTMTIASGATGLETSSGGLGRSLSMPVAKITGDEEYESLEEEEVERDWSFGVAKVVSTDKELIQLNLVENGSEDAFLDATGVTGKEIFDNGDDSFNELKEAPTSVGSVMEPLPTDNIQGNTERDASSLAKTEAQDEKYEHVVATESLGVQSYSSDRDKYDKPGNLVYNVADLNQTNQESSNKNSAFIDNSEDKEAKLEPEPDTVGGVNSEKVGENTMFSVGDANHKQVEGAKDEDTSRNKLAEERGKGKATVDGFHFDVATDCELSISGENLDEVNLNESEEEGDETVEFDPAALASLIRQATGAPADSTIAITSAPDGTRLFSVDRAPPADLSPSSSSPQRIYPERSQADGSPSGYDFVDLLTEEGKKVHEKVESVRVKFIRLVRRLGLSIEDNQTVTEVLNRLVVAEGLKLKTWLDEAEIFENAKREALRLDAEGKDLNFSCTILVLGKTGVGKSTLINSIFKNEMVRTDAFGTGTNRVREVVGVVDGVTLRLVDTPGLHTSVMDQGANRKLLSSIKRHVKKHPPDVVLYVDRVDLQTRNFDDIPILTSITETLDRTVWQKVVRVLTHAGLAPPEGPSGAQLDYEMYVAQQVHATQRTIQMAIQDATLSNPVALVENHASCRTNLGGERVLPNGTVWRPNLLLLCYSVKIMSEVFSVLKPNNLALSDASFGLGMLRLPLQFFLSSLLQSRPHLKLTAGVVESDNDSDELSDLDLEREGEHEYDALPPFKPLKKSQIEKLNKEQKKAYFEEYAYRIKLFEKKQLKEARRSKEMKRKGSDGSGAADDVGDLGKEQGASESVHVNDLALPLSFDGDCPSYRYRSLENSNSWVHVRAVSDSQGWDHDCGLNGVIVDHNSAIGGRFPASAWVQLKKNKEEFAIHLDSSICTRHGEAGSTLTSLEIQKFGRCMVYILNGETRLKNLVRNSTTGGISVAFSGDTFSTGWKISNHARISKRVTIAGTTGMVHANNSTIYGCNLEAQIRNGDYPAGKSQSSIELNLVKLKSVLSIGASFKTHLEVFPGSKLSVNLGVDGKRTGHVSLNVKSAEHTQIAILGLVSLGVAIFKMIRASGGDASTGSKILQ